METGRECRICMVGSDEESLIQPCRCTSAYVHESCLQKWRNENTDNEKYIKCEICQADYVVLRDYPKETFEIIASPTRRKVCPLFCIYTVYLLVGSLGITALDLFCNQTSLVILNGGTSNTMINFTDDDNLSWFIYYLSYTSYIFCMLFYIHILFGVLQRVHRKRFYMKKIIYKFSAYFIMSWTYFYNFYIFYRALKRVDIYMAASLASVPINFLIMKRVAQMHDNTIRELNTNNIEKIISVRYNPLIEITTVNDED